GHGRERHRALQRLLLTDQPRGPVHLSQLTVRHSGRASGQPVAGPWDRHRFGCRWRTPSATSAAVSQRPEHWTRRGSGSGAFGISTIKRPALPAAQHLANVQNEWATGAARQPNPPSTL